MTDDAGTSRCGRWLRPTVSITLAWLTRVCERACSLWYGALHRSAVAGRRRRLRVAD